jgi:hypothetical protein
MAGPVNLRMQPHAPSWLFTVDEANAWLPRLTEIFCCMDPELARLRELQDLFEDAEAYWHSTGEGTPSEERSRHEHLVALSAEARTAVDAEVRQIQAFGCELKDLDHGLIDFPASIDGTISYLCWQRGEGSVANWHPLGDDFADRRPLKPGS